MNSSVKQVGILVCEQAPRWAPALKHALSRSATSFACPTRLVQSRSVAECILWLRTLPQSLIACEIDQAGIAETLGRLAVLGRQFPAARIVALVSAADRGRGAAPRWQAAAQEAGAQSVLVSPRNLGPLLGILRRLCRQTYAESPSSRE